MTDTDDKSEKLNDLGAPLPPIGEDAARVLAKHNESRLRRRELERASETGAIESSRTDEHFAAYEEITYEAADWYDEGIADELIAGLRGKEADVIASLQAQVDIWEQTRTKFWGVLQSGDLSEVPFSYHPKREDQSDLDFAQSNYDFVVDAIVGHKGTIMMELGLIPTPRQFFDKRQKEDRKSDQ